MYRKIMVPLDGSSLAECALEHAREIAQGCNIPVIELVTVVKTFFWWESDITDPAIYQQVADDEKAKGQEYLKKEAAQLGKSGFTVKTVILEGSAAEQLINYARDNGVDLILMTTHGRSGISRFALGSVTDKVVRAVSVPVLIIAPPGCRVNVI
jgi:nucleotide-binding universal stress UspA family protein